MVSVVLLAGLVWASAAVSAHAVAAGGPVDVQMWPQDGQAIVITSVELPQGTKLPAIVRIPVAPGSTVEWAGEIVGAAASGDIPAEYKLAQGAGGEYAEFTLTKSLRGQIDTVASTLTVSGQRISTTLDWVQSVASPQTSFSVRSPSGVSDVKITPSPVGAPVGNEQGEQLYVLPDQTLAEGQKATVVLSYSTAPPVGSVPANSASTIVIVLVAGLVVAVLALILVARRRSSV